MTRLMQSKKEGSNRGWWEKMREQSRRHLPGNVIEFGLTVSVTGKGTVGVTDRIQFSPFTLSEKKGYEG